MQRLNEIEQSLLTASGVTAAADTPSASRPQLGGVSFLHRFGSALNHHVHLHACVTDGVFVPAIGGGACDAPPAFVPDRPITQVHLAAVTERVRRRVIRWFRLSRLLDADMLTWENSGSRSTPVSGSRSSLPTCVSVVRVSSFLSDTVPGRPSRWNGSP
ncbi:MAG: transposase [Planctomycetia bacterium]|nr:transposase [Planctomycetia bacterium]